MALGIVSAWTLWQFAAPCVALNQFLCKQNVRKKWFNRERDAYTQDKQHHRLHDEDRPAHSKPSTAGCRLGMEYSSVPKSRRQRHLLGVLNGENAFKWSASVHATFRIVKENGGFGNERVFIKWRLLGAERGQIHGCGWPEFVGKEDLLSSSNGYAVDDCVEIRVDISVKEVSFSIFDKGDAPAADIKLLAEGSAFYVNKGILSVVSSVFRDMFALTEAADCKKKMEEIELKDLDASEFKEFLGVIYPTRCPITDANVISVFRIADRFDVQHVVTDCETHLAGVNSVPWFDKLKLAVDLHRDHLRNHTIAMMTCDDMRAIQLDAHRDQLGDGVLRAVFERHLGICHP